VQQQYVGEVDKSTIVMLQINSVDWSTFIETIVK